MSTDIEPCIVHMTDIDEECAACDAEVEALNDAYMRQLGKNQEQEKLLASLGQNVNPIMVLFKKVDLIMQLITNGNPKIRLRLETDFARAMEQDLINAKQEAQRARLTNGVAGTRIPKMG